MRITCDNCAKALELPAEKIPDRRFSVSCPACSHKIVVDPQAAQWPEEPVSGPVATAPAASPPAANEAPTASSPSSSADADSLTSLRPLRGIDRQLIATLPQSTVIVSVDGAPEPWLEDQLKAIGMADVQHLNSVEAACDYVQENEVAILLIRMAKASAPPCEPLEPVYRLPFEVRRATFIALVADNVKSLDGQVAFYLQVNCLLNTSDSSQLAVKLRRALLHHLRLYRHWPEED